MIRRTVAALALLALAGCSTAPSATPTRDVSGFLADVAEVQQRSGLDDAAMLKIGDTLCGLASTSTTSKEYMDKLNTVTTGLKMPSEYGNVEFIFISGAAMANLCPAEKARLSPDA